MKEKEKTCYQCCNTRQLVGTMVTDSGTWPGYGTRIEKPVCQECLEWLVAQDALAWGVPA